MLSHIWLQNQMFLCRFFSTTKPPTSFTIVSTVLSFLLLSHLTTLKIRSFFHVLIFSSTIILFMNASLVNLLAKHAIPLLENVWLALTSISIEMVNVWAVFMMLEVWLITLIHALVRMKNKLWRLHQLWSLFCQLLSLISLSFSIFLVSCFFFSNLSITGISSVSTFLFKSNNLSSSRMSWVFSIVISVHQSSRP